MILSAEIVAQIKRHQRTMVRLPISTTVVPIFTSDPHRLCPFKPGRAYKVKTKQHAPPACEITIETAKGAVFEDEPIWEIRFKLGNHTDEDRYPAARAGGAGGDYTSVPSRKLNGTGAEVSAHELSRYALTAHESHENGVQAERQRLADAISKFRLEVAQAGVEAPRAIKLLKATERELRSKRDVVCSTPAIRRQVPAIRASLPKP